MNHRKHIPTTYGEALTTLAGRSRRTIANNTRLQVLEDGAIGLWLHATRIVTFRVNGTIILNTGGWQTVTSKDRLNRVLRAHGWNIYAQARVWYIAHRDGATFEFADGFAIPPHTPRERQQPSPDARVENHGTIFLVRPLTDALREHLEQNVEESAQWFGNALAVEHRCILSLVSALREAGFVVEAA